MRQTCDQYLPAILINRSCSNRPSDIIDNVFFPFISEITPFTGLCWACSKLNKENELKKGQGEGDIQEREEVGMDINESI